LGYQFIGASLFTVADLGLFILLPIGIIKLLRVRLHIHSVVMSMLMFILLHFLLYVLLFRSLADGVLGTTLHFLFALGVLAVFVPHFFDFNYGMRIMKFVVLFSSFVLIAQFILYHGLGYYLSVDLPFLSGVRSWEYNVDTGVANRFRAFFSEPAAFSTYICMFLALYLFTKRESIREYVTAIIVTIAVILAGSSTGLALIAIIWVIWFFRYRKYATQKLREFLPLILIIGIGLIFVVELQTGMLEKSINHVATFGPDGISFERGWNGRVGSALSVFDFEELTISEILFGKGMLGSTNVFLPSFSRFFLFFGATGFVFLTGCYLLLFLKSKGVKRIVMLLIIFCGFFSGQLLGVSLAGFLPFVIVGEKYLIETKFFQKVGADGLPQSRPPD
jgi:hypothetical protein